MNIDIHFHTSIATNIATAFATHNTDIITIDYARKPTQDRDDMLDAMRIVLAELGSQDAIIPIEATYSTPEHGEPTLHLDDLQFLYPVWTPIFTSTEYDPRLHAAIFVTSTNDTVSQWQIEITDQMTEQIKYHITQQFAETQPSVENPYILDSIFIVIP